MSHCGSLSVPEKPSCCGGRDALSWSNHCCSYWDFSSRSTKGASPPRKRSSIFPIRSWLVIAICEIDLDQSGLFGGGYRLLLRHVRQLRPPESQRIIGLSFSQKALLLRYSKKPQCQIPS